MRSVSYGAVSPLCEMNATVFNLHRGETAPAFTPLRAETPPCTSPVDVNAMNCYEFIDFRSAERANASNPGCSAFWEYNIWEPSTSLNLDRFHRERLGT